MREVYHLRGLSRRESTCYDRHMRRRRMRSVVWAAEETAVVGFLFVLMWGAVRGWDRFGELGVLAQDVTAGHAESIGRGTATEHALQAPRIAAEAFQRRPETR